MIDNGSDSSIVSENVANHLELKINRKKVHRLNGVASKSHSLGTVNNVPITIVLPQSIMIMERNYLYLFLGYNGNIAQDENPW